MINQSFTKVFAPVILAFLISSALAVLGKDLLASWNISLEIILTGNAILFIATAISFYFYLNSLKNNRAAVFLRNIYGGMMIKMFICLIAALVYIVTMGKEVNKGAIFGCMFLYFVYSFLEVSILLKLSNKQKNAATGSTD